MVHLKDLVRREEQTRKFFPGHGLCAGCGAPILVRVVLNTIQDPVVVINATGCLEVATTRYPYTAWGVPWIHVAFENAAAVASGVETAYRALRSKGRIDRDVIFVVFGGDGGTYDIGLQALSGALERGHRFVYICYDNEAYMNTGNQRSGATPMGASTSTTPAGAKSPGKLQRRKDLTEIVISHHIPYVAQASISEWQDLAMKVERASQADGSSFINVLSTCTRGWGFPMKKAVDMAHLAVQTCYWPLYEVIEEEIWNLTYEPEPHTPEERAKWGRYGLDITEWLRPQRRFRHLFRRIQVKEDEQDCEELVVKTEHKALVGEIQRRVEDDWQRLLLRCGRAPRVSV